MAVYGYTTKRDLTAIGSLAVMALLGLIVATIINLFLKSSGLSYVLSYMSIAIFIGLTAYDTQKIKRLETYSESRNLGILGALTLYLDFINIFLDILRLIGKGRDT
jgi:FtsH-binding integral membrane protein